MRHRRVTLRYGLPGPVDARRSIVKRTAVNPWTWSEQFGFNQGEVVEGATRVLFCAGQTSVDADGNPQHPGDMAAQIALAADNLEAVLREAGMSLSNVVRLNFYTTDVDAYFEHAGVIGERTGAAGVAPAGTLVGVTRLAYPELMVELEATAVA
jgi:enamine deaminase RidA (YjgF/YER057c/UK114 family)